MQISVCAIENVNRKKSMFYFTHHDIVFVQYLRIQSPFCQLWPSSHIHNCDIVHQQELHLHAIERRRLATRSHQMTCILNKGNPADNHYRVHLLEEMFYPVQRLRSWNSQKCGINRDREKERSFGPILLLLSSFSTECFPLVLASTLWW